MSQEQPVHISYLLRLWPQRVNGETVWRASLESAVSAQQEGFANLDDLFDFLRRRTGVISQQGEE